MITIKNLVLAGCVAVSLVGAQPVCALDPDLEADLQQELIVAKAQSKRGFRCSVGTFLAGFGLNITGAFLGESAHDVGSLLMCGGLALMVVSVCITCKYDKYDRFVAQLVDVLGEDMELTAV